MVGRFTDRFGESYHDCCASHIRGAARDIGATMLAAAFQEGRFGVRQVSIAFSCASHSKLGPTCLPAQFSLSMGEMNLSPRTSKEACHGYPATGPRTEDTERLQNRAAGGRRPGRTAHRAGRTDRVGGGQDPQPRRPGQTRRAGQHDSDRARASPPAAARATWACSATIR